MSELILKGNPTYSWTRSGNDYFIGFVSDKEGKTYRENEAIDFLKSLLVRETNVLAASKEINGIFSFIRQDDNSLSILSDIVNFLPIFYYKEGQTWVISDDWNSLIDYKKSLTPNYNVVPGFLAAGFVTGNQTLDSQIFKTRAGSILHLNNDGTIHSETNFNFLPAKFSEKSFDELCLEAESKFIEAGKRMISFLDGRTAMLPLSGGYDSRMIACTLKRLGYEKVICFTYGRKNSETEISHQVAKRLGYEWHFVNYFEIDYSGFISDSDFKEYTKKYANGYSMVFLQEYFAMRELTKAGIVPIDSVFLPGHSGDYLGGSYVEKTAATSSNNRIMAVHLENKYFFFKKPEGKNKQILLSEIDKTLAEYPDENKLSETYNPYVEDWDVKEKLSKFIFRSSYVFTHFGFEHIYPLWDRALVDFFRELPFKYRSGKYLYDVVAEESFFKPLNVYFDKKEIKRSRLYVKYQSVKDQTRNLFPWSFVLKRMIQNDWLNYYSFTSEMEKDLEKKDYKPLKRFKLFTVIICRWYLDLIGFPKSGD